LAALLLIGLLPAAPAAAATVPVTVLSGLALPDELAAAPNGDLYFLQSLTPTARTLFRLRRGAAAPEAVLSVPDYPDIPEAEPPIQSIGFDLFGHVYWVQRAIGHSAVVELDPASGTTVERLALDGAPVPRNVPLTSGGAVAVLAVDPFGSLYVGAALYDPALGHAIGAVYALARGVSAPALLGTFTDVDSTLAGVVYGITADARGHAYALVNGHSAEQVWELGTGAPPRLVTAQPGHPFPGVNTYVAYHNIGATPRGDLYVTVRTRVGQTGFGCAGSTEAALLHFAPGAATGTIVSDETRPGFRAGFVPSQAYFRVSILGQVYFQLDEVARSTCPPAPGDPSYPVGLAVYGVPLAAPGTLRPQVLLASDTLGPGLEYALPPTYAIGPDGALYIASRLHGTISRVRL
jgi:hypothetical protein